MSSTKSHNDAEELIDITDLIQRCATQCLSHSHPFTPLAKEDNANTGTSTTSPPCNDAATDGTLLNGLYIQGKTPTKNGTITNDGMSKIMTSPKLIPLDLQDAMTALELGDKRMDCCEIPLQVREESNLSDANDDGANDSSSPKQPSSFDSSQVKTFPPRIAPKSLSDGTPLHSATNDSKPPPSNNGSAASSSDNNTTLHVPTPPCPSLLPHWNTLNLTNNSTSSLLSLLTLQLTSLEAYIGTNNGGSNAAETLYCNMWHHDGILVDMSERLNAAEKLQQEVMVAANHHTKVEEPLAVEELTVAQWVLFASSLGVVRIAEAIRWVVVNADFYEEEDFGVTMHGGEDKAETVSVIGEIRKDANEQKKEEGTSMRFCPALQGSSYIEVVWDTALSYLRLYRSSCMLNQKNGHVDKRTSTLDAMETILQYQQSFFQSVKILSNLNHDTVVDFTNLAVEKTRETVGLLEKLRDNNAMVELSKDGLLDSDGRLLQPESNGMLAASFDPFVNRRLLGNAPVRKANFLRHPLNVLTSLSQLASELEWGVCNPILYGNTLGRITRMFESNSLRGCGGVVPPKLPTSNKKTKELKSKKEGGGGMDEMTETPVGMNILSRSLVVLNLYFDNKLFGQYDFSEMIGQHMRQQCAVPELLLTSTDWLSRMAKPMYDTLKSLCLNRHRERGFTESILLPAFQLLQYEAANVDEKFRREHGLDAKTTASYASNYVIVNTIRLMERHVGIGIELGLYPNWYDLSTALWYRDFLLSALINVKGSVERERVQRREIDLRIREEEAEEEEKKVKQAQLLLLQQQQQQQSKKKGKTKKGKNKSKQQQQQQPTSPIPSSTLASPTEASSVKLSAEDFEDRLDYTSLLLHRNLCRGLVRYIAALRQAKLLLDPPASITMFTTHQKRFEKRFEAFSTLPQPPSLSYEDYIRGSDFSAVQSQDLLSSASDCFRSGKGVVDWLLDVIVPAESCDEYTIDLAEKRKDDDLYIGIRREEIMALAKVCVSNSLFLHKLASMTGGAKNSGKSSVSLDFKAHKLYCT
eukprot:CAMPEP_0172302278 /NCGR_PEP_ID=MMETSP1058-20130122/4010_1 /TAXON_ID=83371 /ORGANISM="Detonula confervacea, Strain CCMP 353" /LENGTH=1036 /DNA_ID=CAMNT_0013012701 /DNA_START=265 /DNA_END=3371 /DNA_ORIENTATION=-